LGKTKEIVETVNNLDSNSNVRGESVYLDDIPLVQGTLFACVFNSPVAHGKIVSVDTPLSEVTETDFESEGFFQMGRPPVRIDILMSTDGVAFEDASPNRRGGVPATFISPDDLVGNKLASSKPQDVIDIESTENARSRGKK
jgi:hypothetical protein